MVKLSIERIHPYVGGVAAAAAWFFAEPTFSTPTEAGNIVAASLTIGSIMIGFLIAATAWLMGLQHTSVMKDIRSSGYITDLVSYMVQAIGASFLFCVVTLFGYFLASKTVVFGAAWVAIGSVAVLAFVRVVIVLKEILRYTDEGTQVTAKSL